MHFKILVDTAFLSIGVPDSIVPVENKWVLSLVNDFEDGLWRREHFENFVWDNIAETALSHREREALAANPHSLLVAAAKNLRLSESEDDVGYGSELAEVLLYGIMRHKFGALPVVPKIFYKQNAQDYAKGSDSVHIVEMADDDFTLWFGEAKFYKNIEDTRLASIVTSVKNSLSTDKLKKENSIIVNLQDLDRLAISEKLKERIKSALANKNSIDDIKSRIHVPILLLHECVITAAADDVDDVYIEEIKTFHRERAIAYFEKQVSGLSDIHLYEKITFHLILFPVPSKDSLVRRFVGNVAHYKG